MSIVKISFVLYYIIMLNVFNQLVDIYWLLSCWTSNQVTTSIQTNVELAFFFIMIMVSMLVLCYVHEELATSISESKYKMVHFHQIVITSTGEYWKYSNLLKDEAKINASLLGVCTQNNGFFFQVGEKIEYCTTKNWKLKWTLDECSVTVKIYSEV
jgi:hypothetical protein